MDIGQKIVRIDAMLGHQAGERRAVRMKMRFLDAMRFFGIAAEQIFNELPHAYIDQREQIGRRRIEAVVQIEDPAVDMGKRGDHREARLTDDLLENKPKALSSLIGCSMILGW